MMKKLFSVLFTFFAITGFAFSIPGVDSLIEDKSGDYVYYRDNSFTRESYIGILTYDEANYQIRYFAPFDEAKKLPEKEISVLLTVNPDSDFWDMTGERIISTITPDSNDVEILNYLHDILYEFSARRIKLGDISPENEGYVWGNDFWENGIKSKQEYEQFGGPVTISFDLIVPLFNIKKIETSKGSVALECCVIGNLKANNDQSFDTFKGMKDFNDSNKDNCTVYKKIRAKNHTYNNHTVSIDTQWSVSPDAPMLCTLNDDAVIIMAQVPYFYTPQNLNDIATIRGYLSSVYYSYKNLKTCELHYDSKKDSYKIVYDLYGPDDSGNDSFIYSNAIITRNSENGFDSFELNSYKGSYKANSAYFDKIVKSFK